MAGTSGEVYDVLVVGAGLAGLQCARELLAAGRDVTVWEASDDVGGRVRTDVVDGFLIDRGFQVLNPAYPAVRRWVDTRALAMRPFGSGVAARLDDRRAVLANPLRTPARLPATLRSGLLRPGQVRALASWGAVALGAPRRIKHRPDRSLSAALDAAGVAGPTRRVVERFFAGVLLEESGTTSEIFALLLVRMFALGVPGVPATGMQALPRQLAAELGPRVTTHRPVDSISPGDRVVAVSSGARRAKARHVVVATDGAAAARLTGEPSPTMKAVTTWWFESPDLPKHADLLHVDARSGRRGPLVNACAMSHVAPSYAPPGRHLIQASTLGTSSGPEPSEGEVRRHAGEMLGIPTSGWQVVARSVIAQALPEQSPGRSFRQPVTLGSGVFVCGDHRDTASIQGALVSGHRAAAAVLAAGRRG